MKFRIIALVALTVITAVSVPPAFAAARKASESDQAMASKSVAAPAPTATAAPKRPKVVKAAPAAMATKSVKATSAPEAKEKTPPAAQISARALVAELSTAERTRLLTLLNEGTPQDLAGIKGISKTRATAIEQARPFETADQVILVSGIGKGTMAELVSHARGLAATPKKSSPSAPAPEEKKS